MRVAGGVGGGGGGGEGAGLDHRVDEEAFAVAGERVAVEGDVERGYAHVVGGVGKDGQRVAQVAGVGAQLQVDLRGLRVGADANGEGLWVGGGAVGVGDG